LTVYHAGVKLTPPGGCNLRRAAVDAHNPTTAGHELRGQRAIPTPEIKNALPRLGPMA